MKDVDFSGNTVVVTGGACGIGRAIAEAFAAAGARVAVLDVKHEETASLLEELPGEGHLCVVWKRTCGLLRKRCWNVLAVWMCW